jgi:hypothetical protein
MSTAVEGDFLCGAGEICAYVNTLFGARKFTPKQVYRLIETGRLPAGRHGERVLIASKKAIRAALLRDAGAAA